MKQFVIVVISCFAIVMRASQAKAEPDTAYSFIVAGHAYGAHAGTNIGLHPPLLSSFDRGIDTRAAFFVFTGDIVNQSTAESWQQVDEEMSKYALPYYYSMGNHDSNSEGYKVFEEKFGGTYYAFMFQSDLHVVLNSIEADRAISSTQLSFLTAQIDAADESVSNVFIYFHEIIWNSSEKYKEVRSNSRSRYDQIKDYSNYWDEVHPVLEERSTKNFYLISGDVGGNPDAIAVFYDRWDNVTLISSGMGEVSDENYLQATVYPGDTVLFEPVALNEEIDLYDILFYTVPPAPDTITGPLVFLPGQQGMIYSVPEVYNAESYIWNLPDHLSGNSSANSIQVNAESSFISGDISVSAYRDGYGKSTEKTLTVEAEPVSAASKWNTNFPSLEFLKYNEKIVMEVSGFKGERLFFELYDASGRMIEKSVAVNKDGYSTIEMYHASLKNNLYILRISDETQQIVKKIFLF